MKVSLFFLVLDNNTNINISGVFVKATLENVVKNTSLKSKYRF